MFMLLASLLYFFSSFWLINELSTSLSMGSSTGALIEVLTVEFS